MLDQPCASEIKSWGAIYYPFYILLDSILKICLQVLNLGL